jgi:DNA-binding NarL/FixJ family response regulator
MKKILIADDHDLIRVGLVSLFEKSTVYTVVGETCDGPSTISAVERLRPDVLILDNHMPGMGGIEVARQVAALRIGCRIIMLTMEGQMGFVRGAFQAGVRAYVLKHNANEEIFAALEAVRYDQVYLSPSLGDIDTLSQLLAEEDQPADGLLASLTDRERAVLAGVLRSRSNQQIADQLVIGRRTVETHRKNLMGKLGVPNKDKLLKLAVAKKWIELDGEGNILGEPFDQITAA